MNNGIFLLLGTNMGDRSANLKHTIQALQSIAEVINASSVYQTAAWGKTDQAAFYNQALEVTTLHEPALLLQKILRIEIELGRERMEKWGPRLIDIDILFFGERIIYEHDLIIPHPGVPVRRFVLTPMAEIAPAFIHPVLKKTIRTLLNECSDSLEVEKIPL